MSSGFGSATKDRSKSGWNSQLLKNRWQQGCTRHPWVRWWVQWHQWRQWLPLILLCQPTRRSLSGWPPLPAVHPQHHRRYQRVHPPHLTTRLVATMVWMGAAFQPPLGTTKGKRVKDGIRRASDGRQLGTSGRPWMTSGRAWVISGPQWVIDGRQAKDGQLRVDGATATPRQRCTKQLAISPNDLLSVLLSISYLLKESEEGRTCDNLPQGDFWLWFIKCPFVKF